MEHASFNRVHRLLTLLGFRSLFRECRAGESNVAEHLTAEKPKAATRRSLAVKQMDKELVLALAAASTGHLSRKPRKLAKR